MSGARLLAIATAQPAHRMSRDEWISIATELSPPDVDARVLGRLAERSGIDQRACAAFEEGRYGFYRRGEVPGTAARVALWSRAARAMAAESCARALERSGTRPDEVTHVITASCTGFDAPGIDTHLVARLGLAPTVQRLNVGFMGCHAAVNALAAARSAVLAAPGSVALVCCAEVSSAHFHHSARMDQLVANTLFGDGAGAAVIASDTAGDAGAPLLATHSTVFPGTAGEMGWIIGDHGFEMTLGARVPDLLEREVGGWVRRALATHGLTTGDVGGWAIHPGGPRVIDAVLASLRLDAGAGRESTMVLREHGNMSSATLLFILQRALEDNRAAPTVGLAFGPGLVGEMVVIGASR